MYLIVEICKDFLLHHSGCNDISVAEVKRKTFKGTLIIHRSIINQDKRFAMDCRGIT